MKKKKKPLYLCTFCGHRSRATHQCPFCGQSRIATQLDREFERRKQRAQAE